MNADKSCSPNRCIACTVQQCEHHCGGENYCSLDKILAYLGCGVSLHGCSSKAQLLLLTL